MPNLLFVQIQPAAIAHIDVSVRFGAVLFREQQAHPTPRKKLLAKSTLEYVRGKSVV
jgi:hypothetical protein